MVLNFGKFKGMRLQETPKSYQQWLSSQEWFNAPRTRTPLHKQLNGWNGHGGRGEAVYDAIFEQEKMLSAKYDSDCRRSICTCCEGSSYYGM